MLTWSLKPNRPSFDLSSREQEQIVMNGDPNKMPSITVPDTFTPIKRNRWVVSEEDKYAKFAHWTAKFPQGQMIDPWEMWPFAKGVLLAGEEEGVFRIAEVGAGKPPDYSSTSGQSYVEFVEQILLKEGTLNFFKDIERCNALARLCYYDLEGKVAEAEIDCPGELLSQLRPDVDQEQKDYWLSRDHNPLELRGQRAWERKRENFPSYTDREFEENRFRQTYLVIETYTDIWFPEVKGYLEDWGEDDHGQSIVWKTRQWQDNRELALCHTPRLNRFIQRVKRLTLDYGGEWSIDRADAKGSWESHWNEDGIILDA
jgi:hypothetical protein